jgi:SAM-dependent methyltransferase
MKAHYDSSFYARRETNTRPSAEALLAVVRELAPVRSVVDVGCGVGTWLDVFQSAGVDDIFGVEGDWLDPRQLRIPIDRFRAHDLCQPLDLGRTFDLAMSLEVAEHLPSEAAAPFVASLTRHASIVLFAAAVPYQGGEHHVNEQWPEYWAELFAKAGYAVADPIRPRVWNNPAVRFWYAQNTLLYVRRDRLTDLPALAAEVERTDPRRLSLVHPRLYERNSDLRRQSLRKVLAALPHLLTRGLRRRTS